METPKGIQSFEQFEAEAEQAMRPVFRSKFNAMFLDQIDDPTDELEYLIDDFLTVGEKSIIGGGSRSGKSFLAIHAGMCVAYGKEFFGRPVKKGLVIYQAGEGAKGIKKRLRVWRNHFGVPFQRDDPFVLLKAPVDLYRADGDTAALIAEIKAIGQLYNMPPSLVFIDTLATASTGADENSGKDMSTVLANVTRINRETGAAVCLVHHLNADGKKLRGHTSILANVDQVILVSRDEETKVRTVTLDKQKDDEDGITFKFELLSIESGGERADGRPHTSCVIVDLGQKAKILNAQATKGWRLTDSETVVFKALWKSLLDYGEQAPSDLGLPLGTRVVDIKRWREEFVAMSPYGIGEDDDAEGAKRKKEAQKKAIQKGVATLLKFGIIGKNETHAWWLGRPIRGMPETHNRLEPAGFRENYQPPGENIEPGGENLPPEGEF